MQNIVNRADAKVRQLSQYFTGIPCKNGHLTYRYTSSGACSGCIRENNRPLSDQATTARKEAKALLVQVRLRCYEVDREALAAAVWSFAVMRNPIFTLGDVDPRLLPRDKAGGTGLYSFNVHLDDVPQLRTIADSMLKAHKADVVAVRRAAFGPAADGKPVPDQAAAEPWPGDPDYK